MTKSVYFFSTCLIEHLFPKVGLDSVALLRHFEFNVVLPDYPTCCAQPAYNSGAMTDARDVARKTIDALSVENLPVIIPSASCADMIQHHYPAIFANDPAYAKKALTLAKRSHELIEFLSPHLAKTTESSEQMMGLHVSCSARRGTLSKDAWVDAATQLSENASEPMYAPECCGFGGTFSVKAPEISSQMAKDKLCELSKCGDTFVSGDCGCLMHLNGYSEKHKLPVKGVHLASRLAEHYGISHEQ